MTERNASKMSITNPELLAEWDYKKNKIDPIHVSPGSRKKVWWICSKGHSWEATISNRCKLKRGCPVCANRLIVSGVNDLVTIRPDIMKQWDWVKNGAEGIDPTKLAPSGMTKAYWKCDRGHTWNASVNNRAKYKGNQCPICSKAYKTSLPESILYYYLKQYFPSIEKNVRDKLGELNGKELDLFIPELNTAIEYDGQRFHGTKEGKKKDIEKNKLCKEHNIVLIRIREPKCPDLDGYSLDYKLENLKFDGIEKAIKWVLRTLECEIQNEISIDNDLSSIYKIAEIIERENSVYIHNPEIAKEWDYEDNGTLRPENVGYGSRLKVSWIGKCGHKWRMIVSNRTVLGQGCPYCSVPAKLVLPGFNDLKTKHPELAEEWDYDKNGDLKPENCLPGSNNKVWWKCKKCGNNWKAYISSRTNKSFNEGKGSGCPYCRGYYVSEKNSLGLNHPELLSEWNDEKNGDINPKDIACGSQKKYWWRCSKCGYEYQADPAHRVQGRGCPACVGKKIWVGHNDLGTTHPELLQEWDYEKNGEKTPSHYTAGTHKKVWWKCNNGHTYECPINQKSKGSGCPYCSGRRALIGFNDLQTTHPELISEWAFEKNEGIAPTDFSAGSGKKVWWKCPKGHLYKSIIVQRTNGSGCPYCAGNKAIPGETDLPTKNPALAKEWNYEKNTNIKIQEVKQYSSKMVWWKCSCCNYEWKARVLDRNSNGKCPNCNNDIYKTNNQLSIWDVVNIRKE